VRKTRSSVYSVIRVEEEGKLTVRVKEEGRHEDELCMCMREKRRCVG
jgi:hypothetical protein